MADETNALSTRRSPVTDEQAKPGLIYSKMAAIMKAVGNIPKDKGITFKKKDGTDGNTVMVRGIETTMNALHDIMAEHGVFMIPEEAAPEEREIHGGQTLTVVHLRFRFVAEDGSEVSGTMRGEGIDASDKSGSKAVSIALKYFLIITFVAATEGMADSDNEDVHRTDDTPKGADGNPLWTFEMKSTRPDGFCWQCRTRHIAVGMPIVKMPDEKWAAKECVLLAHKIAQEGADKQSGDDTTTDPQEPPSDAPPVGTWRYNHAERSASREAKQDKARMEAVSALNAAMKAVGITTTAPRGEKFMALTGERLGNQTPIALLEECTRKLKAELDRAADGEPENLPEIEGEDGLPF